MCAWHSVIVKKSEGRTKVNSNEASVGEAVREVKNFDRGCCRICRNRDNTGSRWNTSTSFTYPSRRSNFGSTSSGYHCDN